MKTLEEHNDMLLSRYKELKYLQYEAGVSCDWCGTELVREHRYEILPSIPIRVGVLCPNNDCSCPLKGVTRGYMLV